MRFNKGFEDYGKAYQIKRFDQAYKEFKKVVPQITSPLRSKFGSTISNKLWNKADFLVQAKYDISSS